MVSVLDRLAGPAAARSGATMRSTVTGKTRMGIIYADMRLGNDARPDLEEIKVTALVDTGALLLGTAPIHLPTSMRPRPAPGPHGTHYSASRL